MRKKLITLLLVVVLVATSLATLAACKEQPIDDNEGGTLVVASGEFSGKFNPYYAKTAFDMDVADLSQAGLVGVDRNGEVYTDGIAGSKSTFQGVEYTYYSLGKVTEAAGGLQYTIEIRQDVKFADGHVMDIDDVIFSMYVLSDPTYTGSSTFYALPIAGMKAYRTGSIDTSNTALDAYFVANKTTYAADYKAVMKEYIGDEYDWCCNNWEEYAEDYGVANGAELFELSYDNGWDSSSAPASGDAAIKEFFVNLAVESYYGDPAEFDVNYGRAYLVPQIRATSREKIVRSAAEGSTAANIPGIVRINDYTCRVILNEPNATALTKLGFAVTPLHYYGDASQYDYANNKFGFAKGNLDKIKSNNSPLGAGPFTFESYADGAVMMVRNPYYYLGKPNLKYVKLIGMNDDEVVQGIAAGTVDVGNPSFDVDTVGEMKALNGNGSVNGAKVFAKTTLNLGYGYIGISAKHVKVAGDENGGSEASKNLRKGYATLFAAYREMAYASYYADAATVIQYPISNTSWAAPLTTDNGYAVAFSKDVNGNDIYTSGMTQEERFAAALEATIGYFEAADYHRDGSGKFTDIAPQTVLVPGLGKGSHPNYAVLDNASKALDTIGVTLTIDDRTSTASMWPDLESGKVTMWTAAWQAAVDPDMYQVYHSSNVVGQGGTDSNHYAIADDNLDDLILKSQDEKAKSTRKAILMEAMEVVLDWAVEVPAYQRLNAFVFSSERLDESSICVVSPYYSWMAEIENIKLK